MRPMGIQRLYCRLKLCWTLCSQHVSVLLFCAPIKWSYECESAIFKTRITDFFFFPKTTCSAVWSGDLIDYIHRAGECFHVLNCVELQFHIEQNLTFFSCETSSIIYWCNKLWASGFGLSFYFYSFFSRKSQTVPVICGTVSTSSSSLYFTPRSTRACSFMSALFPR